jgi:hypothetical protein
MNQINKFTDVEKSITDDDIQKTEGDIGQPIPSVLKRHFLKTNGGTPKRRFWIDKAGEIAAMEINVFLPIKNYLKPVKDLFTLDIAVKNAMASNRFPEYLIPFAYDSGANYFAMHIKTNEIFFIAMDTWRDSISREDNFEINTTKLANNFSDFIDGLVTEKEAEKAEEAFFTPETKTVYSDSEVNVFENCEKPITINDIAETEKNLGKKIPDSLKKHILKYNGGIPLKKYWTTESKNKFETAYFFSIKYIKKFKNAPDFLIDGFYKDIISEGNFPEYLLAISRDDMANLFCIDFETGKIYHYSRDNWNKALSREENFKLNTTFIANNLEEFINGLRSS